MAISWYNTKEHAINDFHCIRRRVGTFFQAAIGRPANPSTPLLLLFIDEKSRQDSMGVFACEGRCFHSFKVIKFRTRYRMQGAEPAVCLLDVDKHRSLLDLLDAVASIARDFLPAVD
jgi:hypothetical protein